MPRKKSIVPAVDAAPSVTSAAPPAEGEETEGISSFELPKSIVARVSKSSIASDVKMQKDIPLAMVKGSTVFINYLAALSHDTASDQNHKTIAAAHVLEAVKQLGWEDGPELIKLLKSELTAFRALAEAKKLKPKVPGAIFGRPPAASTAAPASKGKAKAKATTGSTSGPSITITTEETPGEGAGGPKMLVDDGAVDDDEFYKDGEEEEDEIDFVEEEEEDGVEEEEEGEEEGLEGDEEMKDASDDD